MDFSSTIVAWYYQHKRDLPWRNSKDPYIIWLSEIILQQTRVEQGLPYFFKFSEKYPNVAEFAAASEDEILRMWQGLGYYSRGRNMLQTANIVMEEHGGYFPKSYDKLIKLKGIGDYTAAAISSFAGNEAKAVVDGNVFRLLSRYFGIDTPINSSAGKKEFTVLANLLIDKINPAVFNQAIMEFGSLQCRHKNPLCETCPLQTTCNAFETGRISILPVKLKLQKVKTRYFYYFIALRNDEILINKRGKNDIWENLFELPLIETDTDLNVEELINSIPFQNNFGANITVKKVFKPIKHILSHQKIIATFIQIDNYSEPYQTEKSWFYVPVNEFDNYAQPKLIFAFLKNFSTLMLIN